MKTCLIVDDSKIVRVMAKRIIEELDFAVSEAENGEEAFDFCKKNIPDCILLDWNMPVMTGYDFLVKLRNELGNRTSKVIFCSTESDIEYVKKGMEAGANEYIMKPFDEAIIRNKFSEVGLL